VAGCCNTISLSKAATHRLQDPPAARRLQADRRCFGAAQSQEGLAYGRDVRAETQGVGDGGRRDWARFMVSGRTPGPR
jgi:hypothetical protein